MLNDGVSPLIKEKHLLNIFEMHISTILNKIMLLFFNELHVDVYLNKISPSPIFSDHSDFDFIAFIWAVVQSRKWQKLAMIFKNKHLA